MPTIHQKNSNRRVSGQTSVSTTAKGLTEITLSSVNTTFTNTTAVDGAAWDLSDVLEGDVLVTSDGYKGIVVSVNDGADTVTIDVGWISPDNSPRHRSNTTVMPVAGSTVRIHRLARAKSILIRAATGNGDLVYVGRDADARATDFPLDADDTLVLKSQILEIPRDIKLRDSEAWIDTTRVFILAAAGTQSVSWLLGAEQ